MRAAAPLLLCRLFGSKNNAGNETDRARASGSRVGKQRVTGKYWFRDLERLMQSIALTAQLAVPPRKILDTLFPSMVKSGVSEIDGSPPITPPGWHHLE